eukprot:1681314-Pleurochrysis_carterae.AAC.8
MRSLAVSKGACAQMWLAFAQALPDERALPRERRLLALRVVQRLSLPYTDDDADDADDTIDVVLGMPDAGAALAITMGTDTASTAATTASTTTTTTAVHADLSIGARKLLSPWHAHLHGGRAEPHARAEQCAADFGSVNVRDALVSMRASWSEIASAVEAGEVPFDIPGDMIELGTEVHNAHAPSNVSERSF